MSMFYTNVGLIGDNILFRGVKDGKRIKQKIRYKPRLWVNGAGDSTWRTLEGYQVQEMKFSGIYDARDFVKQYENVENFKIYGMTRYDYAFISDYFPEDIDWSMDNVRIAYLDIEVGSENGFPQPSLANETVTAISVLLDGKMYVFGCGDFDNKFENVEYIKCSDEYELIDEFLHRWSIDYPDVVTGWNTKFFDIPYLVNRIHRLFGSDSKQATALSPWGKINAYDVTFKNKKETCFELLGISDLDYYELYRKYSANPNQESYKLDHICSVELGERKLDYSEYANLHQMYRLDYQKFIEYNIKDVELVGKLEEKLRLIELALTLAYDAKVNYEDVFSQVRMWDVIIYNALKKKKVVIPPKNKNQKDQQYAGAYVKDPIVGMHDWVASFDLNSLYPHLIMMYNLSPETLIDYSEYDAEIHEFMKQGINIDSLLKGKIDTSVLKEKNLTITPNGQLFSRQRQGFLSELMETMYEDRAMYKRKAIEGKKLLQTETDPAKRKELENQISKFNNIQLAKKVTLNSAYGAIGNNYFRFFDIRIAEAITLSGQLAIKWIEEKLNQHLNKALKTNADYVIASDTDSIYLNLGPMIRKIVPNESKEKIINMMDKFCDQNLQPYIDKSYQELATYVNAYAQKMIMKREALADKAIWTAKKRYLINVYDNEGVRYKEPQLKIMGLEAIKSSTPMVCREKIKEAFKIMIAGDESEMITFIEKFRKDFKNLPPEDVAFPRSINDLKKYEDKLEVYRKGTPIHVKGSLLYNAKLVAYNLQKKYEVINDGDKIKFTYMKEPNPFQCTVISFPNILPKEFDLQEYVDYNTQFDKTFLDPLKIVMDAINWSVEKKSTLEFLFG